MSKLNGACEAVSAEAAMSDPPPTPQAMKPETADFVETQRLDFEGWRAFLRASCGDQPEVIDASAFAGWVRPLRVYGLPAAAIKIECGFAAMELGRSAYRSERTHRDTRFAGADYYYAAFQVARRSVLTQMTRSRNLPWVMLHCSMRRGPRHALPTTRNGCVSNCRASC